MPKFIEMNLNDCSILIEVADDTPHNRYRSGNDEKKVLKKLDEMLDEVIQKQIVEHCKILVGAFEKLKEQSISPKKANAEFGLQFNAEGNVFVAKVGSQSTFKISFEWEI